MTLSEESEECPNFEFDTTWFYISMVVSTMCVLYILTEFSFNKKVRYIPSRLMISRAIFNYIAIFVVLITVKYQRNIEHQWTCEAQGAFFLFSLYMASIYYALICWELYLTLKNPFRTPTSGSILFHLCAILICFSIVLLVAVFKKYQYRCGFQICFLYYKKEGFNWLNWLLIYVPVFGICIGGIIATVWSVKRLKSTIIDETFELRWLLIKQQTVIIVCFTINYILQGINWSILFWFNDESAGAKLNPYLLTAFCMIAVVFDALTWIIRKYIKQIYNLKLSSFSSELIPKQKNRIQQIKNISDALRKEVITCIIDGLAQSISSYAKRRIKRTESELISVNKNIKTSVSDNLIENNKYYQSIDSNNTINDINNEGLICNDFPIKIDGKCEANIIDEYLIDPMHMDKKELKVIFRDYGAKVFGYLRRNIFCVSDNEYYNSILPHKDITKISLELIAKFSEGSSGAFFFFTKDMKYLIKTLQKNEGQLLLDSLQKYVNYMKINNKTYLSKYFGLYSIKLYGHCIYFIVNKNIFSVMEKKPNETYDIKGSWIDRNTKHNIGDRQLMKDEDLHKKLALNKNKSYAIYKQLEKDTIFLSEMNIMDYSLILGVYYQKIKVEKNEINNDLKIIEMSDINEEEFKRNINDNNDNNNGNNIIQQHDIYEDVLDAEFIEGAGKYCIGIIDMLQKWDLNKKTERFLKSYIQCKDKNGISCIPPIPYRNRFLDKMIEIGIGYKFKERQSIVSITIKSSK